MFNKKKRKREVPKEVNLTTSLVAGAAAGLVVDVALFPLDTLKTRLQSEHGFWKSGGFRGIYNGVTPVVLASAPTAAVFFVTYNAVKNISTPHVKSYHQPFVHIAAASFAEVVSCIIRVPSEVVKQRRQACLNENSAFEITRMTLKREGLKGMYRGFMTTILRDIPYAGIQFPLWEFFKKQVMISKGNKAVTPGEGATCGALAGAVAGAVTTPLDVVKTRQMLYEGSKRKAPTFSRIAKKVYEEKGVTGFFSGFIPRVIWIFLGGGLFFGVYEEVCSMIQRVD